MILENKKFGFFKKIHPWQTRPIIKSYIVNNNIPVWTLVMPVFNQRERIKNVLQKIALNAYHFYDVIMIDDGSDDESLKAIESFFIEAKGFTKISKLTIIYNEFSIFETACDNQGFRLASTEYIIEIQADIHINEMYFDKKMIDSLIRYNLAAVSGRFVHAFSLLDHPIRCWLKYPMWMFNLKFIKNKSEACGKIGKKIFDCLDVPLQDGVYIGETVARGPWLLRKSDLENLGYLDEDNFFLGHDDHDYHRRIYQKHAKNVGYVPLNIFSIESDGSSRKSRTGVNKEIYSYLRNKKNFSDGYKLFLKNYRPFFEIKKCELLICSDIHHDSM